MHFPECFSGSTCSTGNRSQLVSTSIFGNRLTDWLTNVDKETNRQIGSVPLYNVVHRFAESKKHQNIELIFYHFLSTTQNKEFHHVEITTPANVRIEEHIHTITVIKVLKQASTAEEDHCSNTHCLQLFRNNMKATITIPHLSDYSCCNCSSSWSKHKST